MSGPAPLRSPLVELTLARLREVWRQPGTLFWIFGFPVLLAIGLGVAFRSRPPEKLRAAVVGLDAAATAEGLSVADDLAAEAMEADAAAGALARGRVDVVVSLGVPHTYTFDPASPNGRNARNAADASLQRIEGRADAFTAVQRPLDRRGARYIDFLLPGLVGLNLMGSSMWGIGWALVEARSRKLLKRFAATPMRRTDLLLSYLLSRLVLLGAEVVAMFVFGTLAFGVAIQGSLLALGVASTLGAAAFAGMALLVAARPRSTEVASGWMNAVMMPMWILSGSFFSYERFPDAVQPALRALPLTALNDALRAVVNEGAGLSAIGPECAVMAAWGIASFFAALKIFRWQ